MAEISVILLNWNKAADTLSCLESIYRGPIQQVEIIVVDNGSTDGSAAKIHAAYPGVQVIETGKNLGYAEGNNTGIRAALEQGARYLFVLNNDTRIAPDTLTCLQAAAEQHPRDAFFGPKILHLDDPQRLQSTGIDLDCLWRSHQRGLDQTDSPEQADSSPVDCLTGAALFLRAEALARIGLLDPDFFLYREDIDWCLRARRAGWGLRYVPDARVWHRSHHVRAEDLPRQTYYLTRNSLLLVRKHKGGLLRTTALTLRGLLTALSWSLRPRWRHKCQERDALLAGLKDYYLGRFGPSESWKRKNRP